MRSHTQLPIKTRLRAGQSLHFYAARGLTVIGIQGVVALRTAPTCLEGNDFSTEIVLQQGEAHLLQQPGWVAIQARTPAEVLCVAAASRTSLLTLARSGWDRCRQAIVRKLARGRLRRG